MYFTFLQRRWIAVSCRQLFAICFPAQSVPLRDPPLLAFFLLLRRCCPPRLLDPPSPTNEPGKVYNTDGIVIDQSSSLRQADVLEDLLTEFLNSLQSESTFPESSDEEVPSTLLWAFFLLAQHYDKRRQYGKAIELH